ncbi:hypothetical protein JHK82_034061 [Glycine max]|nr:hypothetical protein JHK85_034769 [Glycine max]KAG4986440.1 hypothetical protein JHK86_034131 [Glycine max]KAG5119641.1 hypothetical protein JHK82_034061 [Glycine max]
MAYSLDEMMLQSDESRNIDRSMFGSNDFDGNAYDDESMTLEGQDGEYRKDVDDCSFEEEEYAEYENDDEVEYENMGVDDFSDFNEEDLIIINSMVDIRIFQMQSMKIEDVARLSFSDLEITYQFYCWYNRIVGFFV